MTTDGISPAERAARVEALHQRRAARAGRADALESSAPSALRSRGRPRRHAALGGRLLAGSLSVAATLGLMGVMAGPVTETSSSSAPAATVDTSSAPTVIIVPPSSATESSTPVPQAVVPAAPPVTASAAAPVAVVPAAPPVTASTAAPVTASRAS
jgi:hypothetical protein